MQDLFTDIVVTAMLTPVANMFLRSPQTALIGHYILLDRKFGKVFIAMLIMVILKNHKHEKYREDFKKYINNLLASEG